MQQKPIHLMMFVLLTLSLFSLACGALSGTGIESLLPTSESAPQNAQPAATITPVPAPDSAPTVETAATSSDSSSFVDSVFNSGIPEDIPMLPDATDVLSSPSSVLYTTQLGKDDASEFYIKEMEKLGWVLDIDASVNFELMTTLSYSKPDGRTALITVGTATGQTKISITFLEN